MYLPATYIEMMVGEYLHVLDEVVACTKGCWRLRKGLFVGIHLASFGGRKFFELDIYFDMGIVNYVSMYSFKRILTIFSLPFTISLKSNQISRPTYSVDL